MKKIIKNKQLFNRVIIIFFVVIVLLLLSINFFKTYSETVTDTASHIDGDTVYVNDLANDYNYYLGMNYVGDINSNTVNYSDSNLSSVTLIYHGYASGVSSCTNDTCGYVSLTERQNKFVYYKYYPVVNNQMQIELIDNPFSDRPTDKAFGGWTSSNGTITTNNNTNVQTITVTKTGANQEVNIYANWITAHVVYLKGEDGDDNFDGSIPDDAVGSWERAFSLLRTNSTNRNDRERNIIVLMGDMEMGPNYSRSITHTYNYNVTYSDNETFNSEPVIIEYKVNNNRYALVDNNGVTYTALSTTAVPADNTKWIIEASNGKYTLKNYDTNRYLSYTQNGANATLNMSNTPTTWEYNSSSRKFYNTFDFSYDEYTYTTQNNITSGENYIITNPSENNTLNATLGNSSFTNRVFDNTALWKITQENGGYVIQNNTGFLSSADNGNNGADLRISNTRDVWQYDNINHGFYRQTLINYITYSYNHANYINSGSNYYITNGNDSNLLALSVNGNNIANYNMTNNDPRTNETWRFNNSGSGYTILNQNNNRYLYCSNNGSLSTNYNSRVWRYDSGNHYLYYQRNQNTRYYLRNNNGTWQTTNNANQATQIYFTTRVSNSSYTNTNVYISYANNNWGLTDTTGPSTNLTLKTVTTNHVQNIVNYYLRFNNGFEISNIDSSNSLNFATYTVERTIRTTSRGNTTTNNSNTSSTNVAVTITSLYNHTDYRNSATIDLTNNVSSSHAFVKAYNDLQLEYLSIEAEGFDAVNNGTTTSNYSTTYAMFEGNYNNTRIGRGMTPTSWTDDDATIFGIAYGASSSSSLGSSSSHNNEYRFVVETGRYSSMMGVRIANDGNYSSSSSYVRNYYGKMTFVLGNDYDRVNKVNDHLQVYYRVGSSNNYGIVGKTNSSEPAYLINVKSGNFGYDYFYDNPEDENRAYAGIYVGGLTVNASSSTTDISGRVLVMEGGIVGNLVGGLRLDSSYQNTVPTKIYVKGGKITNVVGGAGVSTTYGNRFVSITGGEVEYSVSGGSNGVYAENDQNNQQTGRMQGNTTVHVGGNAEIGTIGSGELYGVSYGSVLGAGNGNSNVDNSGQVIKTTVAISGSAKINGSVYGGGNYGNVVQTVDMKIDGGTISGSVYGGANKNGVGTVTINKTVNETITYTDHDNFDPDFRYLIVKKNNNTRNALNYNGTNLVNNVLQNNVGPDSSNYWMINSSNGGYTLKNISTGKYLSTESSQNTPKLKLDDNPVVWNYDSNNQSFYKASEYYNNFTVSYNYSTSIITDEEILLTNSNSANANSMAVNNNNLANVVANSSTVPSNNLWIIRSSNGGYTIQNASTGLYLYMTGFFNYSLTLDETPSVWDSDGRNFYYYGGWRTYYLRYDNGWGTSTSSSSATNFYFGRYSVNYTNLTDTFYLGFDNSNWVLTRTNNDTNKITFTTVTSTASNFNATASNRSYGDVTINMTGGEIKKTLYGGSCERGDIAGNITINITGGTIVKDTDNNGSVFGGGYGENTNVAGNINLSIADTSKNVSITGDSYGGSALGTVIGNITVNVDDTAASSTISLLGDTYCGSRGSAFDGKAGNIMGTCTLNVKEGNFSNSFYGGNNENGSAYGAVVVNTGGYSGTATIGNVYGGGKESDSKSSNVTVYVKNNSSIGNVYGGGNLASVPITNVYLQGGTATNTFGGSNKSSATATNVYLQGGNFTNIYGGSNESGDVATTSLTLTGGQATTVYGGNNIGGKTTTSNILVNGSTVTTVYGGGNLAETTTSTVNINSGNVTTAYGGGNEAITNTTTVNLNGGTVVNTYGGGNRAGITTSTNVNLKGSTATNVFGGSNNSGVVPVSNVITTSGSATKVYGGNNVGGSTTTSNVTINGGTITTAYGGGKAANTGTTNVHVNAGATNVYGGGEAANVTVSTNVDVNNGTITNVFGGSDTSGTVVESNITTNGGTVTTVYGGNNAGGSTTLSKINIYNGNVANIYGGGCQASHGTSNIYFNTNSNNTTSNIFGGGKEASCTTSNVNLIKGNASYVYGGSNTSGVVGTANVLVTGGTYTDIYGGNNAGGTTTNTNVSFRDATVTNIYGGGNNANVTGDTKVVTTTGTINNNVFGGGNNAAVLGNTSVTINGTTIGGSAYAGGNGATATVHQNTNILVEGNTNITNHVFGGGNAAYTGILTNNNSSGRVNIIGGTIGGNVYGGANTSVLYGETMVNVGYDAVVAHLPQDFDTTTLVKSNIDIGGTVFGGGEANASGSEDYDYSFISVTVGIIINIDGNGHNTFDIGGSIFGSGNASSTTGYSRIYINNYGTDSDIKENVSIQRADLVVLDNSNIELAGATDRTNEYSTVLFSVSRIDELDLVNNSSVYFQNGANLLKKFRSLKDTNTLATVDIDEDDGTVTRNVNNRVYMVEDKILNVATNQNITSYGEVDGMTFLGMYKKERTGEIVVAMYDTDFETGDELENEDIYYFSGGTYVLGLHETNHNTKVDGFYSNFMSEEEGEENILNVRYIEPTPEDSSYYMWIIGTSVISYEVDLVASKYSTLGTYELPFIDYTTPNTYFSVVGFQYENLDSNVSLVDPDTIPRIASTASAADNTLGLAIRPGTEGWITLGSTEFVTEAANNVIGTTTYYKENSSIAPSILFYLYHSKNLSTNGNLGYVTIKLLAVTPINDLEKETTRIDVVVNLSRAIYQGDFYEAAMTPGRQYEFFSSSPTRITSKSSLSAYYALYVNSSTNIYRAGYHHSLVSDKLLPLNTKITMIDFASGSSPEYYYYVTNAADNVDIINKYNLYDTYSYDLNKFIKMGSSSSNNLYDEETLKNIYYNATSEMAVEEFIFIVDFCDAEVAQDYLDTSLLMEIRTSTEQTIYSVLGTQHDNMKYSLYYDSDGIIDVSATLSDNVLHVGNPITLAVTTSFEQQKDSGNNNIIDTTFYDNKLGIKITIFDENDNQVNGVDLMGVSFIYNGVTYYPRSDGSIRINLAERVANVYSAIVIDSSDGNLAGGNYTLKVESFYSPDGIYYGIDSSDECTVAFEIKEKNYGLDIVIDDEYLIIDNENSHNQYGNNNFNFNVLYSSTLSNPNLRLALYRRTYNSIYDLTYTLVDAKDYLNGTLNDTSVSKVYRFYVNPGSNVSNSFTLKDDLPTGTYKLVIYLFDNDVNVGNVNRYFVIK